MLLRMYLRWAEARGFKAELLEATPGEEAGLKSATFTLTGENAYGIMQAEKGVHRLVRLSPFDSAHRRHTALRPGRGLAARRRRRRRRDRRDRPAHRHVPLPGRRRPARQQDRLGRAHHAPPDRDRRAVPERALAAPEQGAGDADPEVAAARARARGARGGARQGARRGAGHLVRQSQIRSYVLHPYTMVNDHRTNLKIGNAQGVLDGDLDELIHAELLRRATASVASCRLRLSEPTVTLEPGESPVCAPQSAHERRDRTPAGRRGRAHAHPRADAGSAVASRLGDPAPAALAMILFDGGHQDLRAGDHRPRRRVGADRQGRVRVPGRPVGLGQVDVHQAAPEGDRRRRRAT